MTGYLENNYDLVPGKDRDFYFSQHNWTGPGII